MPVLKEGPSIPADDHARRPGSDKNMTEMLAPPKIIDRPTGAAGADPLLRGIFEPPSAAPVAALARHKLLIAVVAIVCAALGVGYGLSRHPVYTASATLQVGQVNPNSPGFYGYVQSAAALASAFSRAIDAEPVLDAVHQKLGLTAVAASGRLSAEPIPVSPAFRVIATGPSRTAAVALANVTAAAVVSYESQSNSANPEASSLLHEYAEASFQLQGADAAFSRLASDKHASAQARAHAGAARTAAQVKLKAIGNSYVAAVTSQAPRSGLVTLLAGATGASSDHRSKVEMFALIGLLVGVVSGCLAAALRERHLRGPSQGGAESQASPSR
ncbi:MAG TPA: Wzz/FepE/Etk N-terminal domain-containing protein [Solirubrobacteraceae bacterium]|nr:Wzz/FepE/Etk N-terminal domain-containing protein [Solirubrobacteraceae bacterium]